MSSDNPAGADNQQGRPHVQVTPEYISGFVDGEGCFSVSIRPHPTVRYGTRCVIGVCFQVYQHRDNVEILEKIQGFFGCGRIVPKGPNSNVMTFAVYRRSDLQSIIVPFFEEHPMLSKKQEDFLRFREVVDLMQTKAHQTDVGFHRIVEIAFSMNQHGKQRRYTMEQLLAEPSETVRRALARTSDETVRPPWRHGEGGRNDRPATQLSFTEWR